MPHKPLISFIVTDYNIPGGMLRQCIDSILSLNLKPEEREIIVIDDGSDIPSSDKMKDVTEDIIVIRQENMGLSSARNNGLKRSTGRYIQFVDGDDCIIPSVYNACIDILRLHQQTDMVMFRLSPSARHNKHVLFKGPINGTDYMTHHNLHGSACGYIAGKHLFDRLSFTEGIYHEDEELTPLLTLRVRNMFYTKAPAYFYRLRPDSITHDQKKDHIEKRLDDSLSIIMRLQQALSTLDREKREALQRRVAQLTMDYIYNVITLTKNISKLKRAKAELRKHGLYPLPKKRYTIKYMLFRLLI